ncbi:hypothetical protein TCA2_4474 [Paenibacillus sp. TCA20]|uniref:DUF2493 domain-containing protein n=1 Tax=Paenibacillus urinalis TaxID=521520 RepID=A0ABY7XNG7_9BACL|nr:MULTISPECIES: DUF2493 domain-containing protein [Paenibacillus]WDI05190.1 DUF2493 domain-containing protein [Paenibacillus urinalis]GAK41982.1 hypothetical protein TCA2_4474 [Paenibacillus sp. TCA20]
MYLVQYRDDTNYSELKVQYCKDPLDVEKMWNLDDSAISIVDVIEVDEYFRLVVAGSRDFDDYALLSRHLDHLLQHKKNIVIVSGNAIGADMLGERYANERGYFIDTYIPNWRPRGPRGPVDRSAGHRRNADMADNGDALVAFWDSISKGTAGMINIAKNKGLQVRVIHYNKEGVV